LSAEITEGAAFVQYIIQGAGVL